MPETSHSPSFRNMKELTAYLTKIEVRLATLESENAALRRALGKTKHPAAQPFKTERGLPTTGLVSDSFFVRAFTVWGHYFIAQLIIGIPIFICYLVLVFSLMNNIE